MILAGPSDMSIKQGEHYITYPLLPVLRDNLLGMVLEKNIGYFDMLEAMGGEGSMEYWVSADPPLAMPDYTHFSPRGARLMGELMYESIMDVKSEKE
jgi:lysophospholipase L1-like esterase